MKNRVYCVLGMHRSGTSCLTGTLKSAGMVLGDASIVNSFNAKGDCEDTRIVRLHKDLLHANGGSWYAPPLVRWSHSFRARRDSIIRDYDGLAAGASRIRARCSPLMDGSKFCPT